MNEAPNRRRPWQFSLASVLLGTALIGACLGPFRLVARSLQLNVCPLTVALAVGVGFAHGAYLGWLHANSNRVGVGDSLRQVALCLYLPFSWVVLIDCPWSDCQSHWVRLWPVLPGLVPGALLFHPQDVAEFTTMGLTTVVLLIGLTWLGTRGRYGLIAATMIALIVSVPSAIIGYALYLA